MSSTQDQAVIQQKTTFVNDFVSNIFDKYGIIEPTIQEISTRYKQIITPLKFSIDNSIQSTRSIADTARIPILRMPAFILGKLFILLCIDLICIKYNIFVNDDEFKKFCHYLSDIDDKCL